MSKRTKIKKIQRGANKKTMTKSFKEEWARWPRPRPSWKNEQNNQELEFQVRMNKRTKTMSFKVKPTRQLGGIAQT
jgi:hypothetical protein